MKKPSMLIATAALVVACDAPPQAESERVPDAPPPISVYVGSHPLEYFAERIGGSRVETVFPVPAGEDPATWSPDPEVILAYQDADLILLNGAEYEEWVGTAALPGSRVVDTSAGFDDRLIYVEDAITHSHGPEGEHSHGEHSSVTWLDLELAVEQAEAVRDALIALEPGSAERFRESFSALADDLRDLDRELESAFAPFAGRSILAATPSYAYLARRYGIGLEALRFDPGNPLGHDFWHDLDHALGHGVERVMLWEGEPPAEVRERLQGLGIEVLVFDPGGARPASGNFLTVMEENRARAAAFDG